MDQKLSVAFVCFGNICRSPMAEAIFRKKVEDLGLSHHFDCIDSFAVSGLNKGKDPDARTVHVCESRGVPISHKAKQLSISDHNKFNYIFGMDENNVNRLSAYNPRKAKARVGLFGEWNAKPAEFETVVDDPFRSEGLSEFEHIFDQLSHFSDEFLRSEVQGRLKLKAKL
ncbi:hypothetical protein BABINDRAFT_51682 [Babjeviella inositovora NRRL Y-12698]|uniref:Phosphotyrosine protein phosphatase I domain-containing protein n=1 Tax=Babjeviella inositovora NRRL Y-12698 TaxID=984486 RepID=A0A1E3QMQ2_9ASCO|nr:uncharacterized protein BABINDRAFT_51682 [Babjeviella inositovora NRRL Y-12698]ODQ78744.1 hypothetical protein BABINDRAFT_51682 [Babjeviella inositovora NRRL Y-12698]